MSGRRRNRKKKLRLTGWAMYGNGSENPTPKQTAATRKLTREEEIEIDAFSASGDRRRLIGGYRYDKGR